MDDLELDKRLRDCFRREALPESTVSAILSKGIEAKAEHARRSSWRPWLPVSAAACFLMLFAFQAARQNDISEFAYQVAGEIAMRHNGDRPVDIDANCYESVQNGLTDLAFSVTPSVKQGLLSAYEILGARYCWLEGQQGVHIRVRNRASGALCSLYVASLDGKLSELKSSDRAVQLEANEVALWEDTNRLFALVE